MSTKYTTTKRCYLIDHHSPQPPDVPLGHLDINEYESFFDTANIDSLMVYCKDHWGVTYYPSNVPGARQHEGVKKDWIGEISSLLKKKDIEFAAYYCIEYDEGAARNFPEWRVQRPDGSGLIREDEFARWSLCCCQTGYREYCLLQLEEIVSRYAPDALFLDILGTSLCYCSACREKFEAQYHYPLPESDEEVLEHRTDIMQFLNNNTKEFLTELRQRVKAIDPELAVTINFSCHYPQEIRDMLEYQFSEPLLRDNWFSSAYARDTAIGQYPMLAPGEASQVYNYNSVNEYIYDLSSIAAQGCRAGMYSGSQHIDGTLDFEEARLIGTAFAEIKKMEPYLTGRTPVKCVGILQSDLSMSINLTHLYPDAILRMKRHNPHQNAVLGAMQLCEHAKLPFRILPERTVTEDLVKQFQVILLPEVFVIQEDVADILRSYVQNGGLIISSGQSGLWNADSSRRPISSVSDLLGIGHARIHTEHKANRWSAYLKNVSRRDFSGLLSCTTPPVSEHFVETVPADSAQILLHLILPCVCCDETHWVNWWSPPPGTDSGYPALIHNAVGAGNVYYLAFDFFTMASAEGFRHPYSLFQDLICMEHVKPVLHNRTETPDMIRTAYFETEDSYIIHQISTLPKQFHGHLSPVNGGSLEFQRKISQAEVVYPEKKELEICADADGTIVRLPEFSLQQIIVCKK